MPLGLLAASTESWDGRSAAELEATWSDERARVSVPVPHHPRPNEGAPKQRSAARLRDGRKSRLGRVDQAASPLPPARLRRLTRVLK